MGLSCSSAIRGGARFGVSAVPRSTRTLRDRLADEFGIMVRHYSTKELNNFIRISVGLPKQTDAVVAALQQLQ